jgi:hypothetical protein
MNRIRLTSVQEECHRRVLATAGQSLAGEKQKDRLAHEHGNTKARGGIDADRSVEDPSDIIDVAGLRA